MKRQNSNLRWEKKQKKEALVREQEKSGPTFQEKLFWLARDPVGFLQDLVKGLKEDENEKK